jgi:lipopolysaccharide transport system ATP-binding protein
MSSEGVPDFNRAEEAPVVIQVDRLSKRYHIYDQPRDRLKQFIFPRIQRLAGRREISYYRDYWALNDVSFQVRRGEAVGIIGRNGAGKSTLLQLICGTLLPSSGTVAVHGRVAALLELGAGFNPEFTGRENVYMSAALLGLSKAEIDERYEAILEFADIGEFVEQPVKIYSSGMYVRLAFAVIAHVDADILIIDEALAVGDAVFVQKCMRFLRAFRERGTLLFVSHDTSSVISFCKSAVWLDRGVTRMYASAEDVCNSYMEYCAQEVYGDSVKIRSIRSEGTVKEGSREVSVDKDLRVSLFENIANSEGWTSDQASIESVRLTDMAGSQLAVISGGEKVRLNIVARTFVAINGPIIGFFVKDRLGQSLFGDNTYPYVQPPLNTAPGDIIEAEFVFHLPMLPDGDYSMTVAIAEGDPWSNVQHHWLHDAVLLKVASTKLRYGLVGIPFDKVEMKLKKRDLDTVNHE